LIEAGIAQVPSGVQIQGAELVDESSEEQIGDLFRGIRLRVSESRILSPPNLFRLFEGFLSDPFFVQGDAQSLAHFTTVWESLAILQTWRKSHNRRLLWGSIRGSDVEGDHTRGTDTEAHRPQQQLEHRAPAARLDLARRT
jgi:hypothetical protein